MESQVSVVITTFNTWESTESCLRALITHCKNNLGEIVVVDDASTSSAPPFVSANSRIIRNTENFGYVKSVNIGIQASSTALILLLDSDAIPQSNLAGAFCSLASRDEKLGVLGYRLVDRQGKPTGNACGQPTWLGLIVGQRIGSYFEGKYKSRVKLIHSCAIGIRRAAFDDVSGFDEDFDFLEADNHFCLKLINSGWNLAIDGSHVAVHEGGGSPQTVERRVIRFHRNRLLLLKKMRGGIPVGVIPLLAVRHIAEVIIIAGLCAGSTTRAKFRKKLTTRLALLRGVWREYQIT